MLFRGMVHSGVLSQVFWFAAGFRPMAMQRCGGGTCAEVTAWAAAAGGATKAVPVVPAGLRR
ncbi:hypothetical protein HEK616_77750 (plasmid) [Streptomyces nigrescens]|uniref:Uncharacterized protein n=1 Tax=Streptomyces nigrescens TaxID=1920 RepID=A0ABM8A705_STRNI|nr:hypothetical protein HEK616_77750 [Streptomyces nigrescens]